MNLLFLCIPDVCVGWPFDCETDWAMGLWRNVVCGAMFAKSINSSVTSHLTGGTEGLHSFGLNCLFVRGYHDAP